MAAPIWISMPILASLVGLCFSHRHLGPYQAQNGPSLGQAHHTNVVNKLNPPVMSSGVCNCDNDGNCMLIDECCNPGMPVPNYPPIPPPCLNGHGCIDDGGRGGAIGLGGDGGLRPRSSGGFNKAQDDMGRAKYYSESVGMSETAELVIAIEDVRDAINALASKASHNQLDLPLPGDGGMYGGNPGEGDWVQPTLDAESPVSV